MGLEMVQVIVGIIGRYLEDGGTPGIFHRIPPTTLRKLWLTIKFGGTLFSASMMILRQIG